MSNIAAPSSGTDGGERSKATEVKEGVASTADAVRNEVRSSASDLKEEAVSHVGQVKDEVTSQASDLLHQTRHQFGHQADEGTHRFGEAVAAAGSELAAMARRSEEDGPMTSLVRQLGDRASDLGDRYQSGGYRMLADDLTSFARRSPGLFLLTAAGAGFVVGRIVRNADTKAIADAARDDSSSATESIDLRRDVDPLSRGLGEGASGLSSSSATLEPELPIAPAMPGDPTTIGRVP